MRDKAERTDDTHAYILLMMRTLDGAGVPKTTRKGSRIRLTATVSLTMYDWAGGRAGAFLTRAGEISTLRCKTLTCGWSRRRADCVKDYEEERNQLHDK